MQPSRVSHRIHARRATSLSGGATTGKVAQLSFVWRDCLLFDA